MRIDEAGRILAEMYRDAEEGEKVAAIHLFGIRYASEIQNIPAKEIAVAANLPVSYGTEIRKRIKLSRYVVIR